MHTFHSSCLEGSVANLIIIAVSLLWLTNLRFLSRSSFDSIYGSMSPSELFDVYGAPGSMQRWLAILIELLVICLAGERIYGLTSLLNAAGLTLQQRHKALIFASEHQPPALSKKLGDESSLLASATQRLDECIRCSEFAIDLSTRRWVVLRVPVCLIYLATIKCLVLATVYMALVRIKWLGFDPAELGFNLDPLVLVCVSVCLAWPLTMMLMAGALANNEMANQRARLQTDANAVLNPHNEANDKLYVALKVKQEEALCNAMICWPGGKPLGFCEPALLLFVAFVAGVFTVASSSSASLLPL